MLAIRMQRTGRKGHAMFRMVVQESRVTPTSGKVVAQLGSYDPHSKSVTLNKEKATYYLTNGAQPSDRAVRILQAEGIALPKWVKVSSEKKRDIRHPEKLRRNQPAPEVTPEPKEEAVAEQAAPEPETVEEAAPVEAEATEAPVEPAEDETPKA